MTSSNAFDDPLFLQRTLSGYAQAMAGFAAALTRTAAPGTTDPAAFQASLAEGYRRLFAVAAPAGAGSPPESHGSNAGMAVARYQAAATRWAELVTRIAHEAAGRLTQALREAGPGAPPVTSLAALQALCIDCGEAAYAEAARREEFAAAQAELLMAAIELSAPR